MVCMQRELSRPPTFFNHVPDACLFGLGGLVFVAAWLWPGAVVFPTVLRWVGVANGRRAVGIVFHAMGKSYRLGTIR